MNEYMQLARRAAEIGMDSNQGGPFGAVIVRNNEIITMAHNEVLGTNDPTAHAEIVAIRRATIHLGRFNLSDCEIYSTCEPCPMCLAAIHWAGITKLHFGADRHDAAVGGFDDKLIYDIINGNSDSPLNHPDIIDKQECAELFQIWNKKANRKMY